MIIVRILKLIIVVVIRKELVVIVEDDPDHADLTRIALQTERVPFKL